jgi:hypothetical protein
MMKILTQKMLAVQELKAILEPFFGGGGCNFTRTGS